MIDNERYIFKVIRKSTRDENSQVDGGGGGGGDGDGDGGGEGEDN